MLTEIASMLKRLKINPGLSSDVYQKHLEENLPSEADLKALKQRWQPLLPKAQIDQKLESLSPHVAWCHFYQLGDDHYTVRPAQAKHFSKARVLKEMADLLVSSLPYICKKQDLREISVLDLACAEGGHSIELAAAGVKNVVGIEGRQMYVDRANFIAECAGLKNVRFQQGDVRHTQKSKLGTFDLVLFFGILHHLSEDDYFQMLKSLYEVTEDTLVLYTHTAEPGWEVKFKLGNEITNKDGIRGRLYREHPDGASEEVKAKRNRNSLDNTFSFWAREASLLDALKRVGFKYISKQLSPNPFDQPTSEFRVLYICRK